MGDGLHIKIVRNNPDLNRFDLSFGSLLLPKAGSFVVTVKEYEEKKKLVDSKHDKDEEIARNKWNERAKAGWSKAKLEENWKANEAQRDATKNASQGVLETDFKEVNWVWTVAPKKIQASELSHNDSFNKGISGSGKYSINFPKILEGGGMAYLEAFLPKDGAKGVKPHGIFVQATGAPRIVRVEWTDFDYNILKNRLVAFNSEVLLHIYTEALYGQELEIKLFDEDIFKDDKLSIGNGTAFQREVNIHKVHPKEIGKPGVDDTLVKADQDKTDNKIEKEHYLQKTTIEIKVDHAWMKAAGEHLKIYPTVKSLKTGKYFENFSRDFLEVCSIDGILYDVPKEVTNMPVVQSQIETNVGAYHPCRYDKIELNDVGNEVTGLILYDVENNVEDALTYECLASTDSEKPEIIDLIFHNHKTIECVQKKEHTMDGKLVFNQNDTTINLIGNSYQVPVNADANKILLRAKPELFFITPDKINKYKFSAPTCAQGNQIVQINVYPKIERELAFILTLFKSFNAETNVKDVKTEDGGVNRIGKRDTLTGYSGEKGMKLIDGQLEVLYQAKGGLGFGLQAKVKVDDTISLIELGKTKNQIKELLGFYYKIIDLTKDLDGRGKEGTSLAFKKGSFPKATFDIEAPNVALALRMTNKQIQKDVVTEYLGGIALKPILGIKIGVDLISLIPYFGLQGKIASEILNFFTSQADIEIYLIFEISFQARAEFNLAYNEIEGLKAGKQKFELEALATGKIGIKSRDKATLTIVTRDGTNDSASVEKFKAEGSLASGLLYTYEVNGDKKGMYSQHKLEFTGLKATIIVYALDQQRKNNSYFKKEFTIIEKPKDPWYKSDKEYF